MSKKTLEAKKKTSAPRKKATKRTWITRAKLGAFLAPSFGGVSIFYAVPFLVVIFYAMVDNPISKRFVFLDNFINVFQNQAFQLAAWNTFKFSLTAVPLAVIISLLMAFLLDKRIPFASKFRSIYLSPMMVPVASIILVFQVLFNYNGVMNMILEWFGGSQIDWFKSDWAPLVVLLLFLWNHLFWILRTDIIILHDHSHLVSLAEHHIFKVHPHCSMCSGLHSFQWLNNTPL